MRKIHLYMLISPLIFLTSCTNNKENARQMAQNYFYPTSEVPQIYVFQDSLDPFFELFERIVTYYDPMGEHLLIERYNSNFTLVESYDMLVEKEYKVINHKLYDGEREITAQIKDSTFMPWSGSGIFSSNFPSTADSIVFSMKNKRSLNEREGSFVWNKKLLETKIFTDSIYTIAYDLKNQREKNGSAVAYHEFAEGIGRVRIKTSDGKSNLILVKIISEGDWKRIITK